MSANYGPGRPLMYTSPKKMWAKIEEYFEQCKGEPLINQETGEPYLNKKGLPVIRGARPITEAGLAAHLGFCTVKSLNDYREKEKFKAVIDKAKLIIQAYAEERLYDKDGSAGAKFYLQNKYDWKTESEITINPAEGESVLSEIRQRMAATQAVKPPVEA